MKRILFAVFLVMAVLLGSALPVSAYVLNTGAVSIVPVAKPALAIKAPLSAPAGATFIDTVTDSKNNAPVSEAKLWALPAGALPVTASATTDMSAYVSQHGTFLGKTDEKGQVFAQFAQAGQYLLVAVKDGYNPGFSKISIGSELKALAIRAPVSVKILQPFSLRVVETSILTVEIPVAGADVWAVSAPVASPAATNADIAIYAQKYGIHLGITGNGGYINPEPELSRAGTYWLVALKDGYTPAISKILVVGPVTITPIPFPTPTVPPVPTATPLISTTRPVTGVSPASSVVNASQIPAGSIIKK
jgi:hypothetical protein